MAAVCHGAGVCSATPRRADGTPLVQRARAVTGFTNTEEAAVGLTDVVPFLVEDVLKANGGRYSKAGRLGDATPIVDGNLITGQNPASSQNRGQGVARDAGGERWARRQGLR